LIESGPVKGVRGFDRAIGQPERVKDTPRARLDGRARAAPLAASDWLWVPGLERAGAGLRKARDFIRLAAQRPSRRWPVARSTDSWRAAVIQPTGRECVGCRVSGGCLRYSAPFPVR